MTRSFNFFLKKTKESGSLPRSFIFFLKKINFLKKFFIRISVQTRYFSSGSKIGSKPLKSRYPKNKKIRIDPDWIQINSKRIEALIYISVYSRYPDIRGYPRISAISIYPRISTDIRGLSVDCLYRFVYPWTFIRNEKYLSVIRTDTRITDTRIQTLHVIKKCQI